MLKSFRGTIRVLVVWVVLTVLVMCVSVSTGTVGVHGEDAGATGSGSVGVSGRAGVSGGVGGGYSGNAATGTGARKPTVQDTPGSSGQSDHNAHETEPHIHDTVYIEKFGSKSLGEVWGKESESGSRTPEPVHDEKSMRKEIGRAGGAQINTGSSEGASTKTECESDRIPARLYRLRPFEQELKAWFKLPTHCPSPDYSSALSNGVATVVALLGLVSALWTMRDWQGVFYATSGRDRYCVNMSPFFHSHLHSLHS
jgi:hypothetical protein